MPASCSAGISTLVSATSSALTSSGVSARAAAEVLGGAVCGWLRQIVVQVWLGPLLALLALALALGGRLRGCGGSCRAELHARRGSALQSQPTATGSWCGGSPKVHHMSGLLVRQQALRKWGSDIALP